MKTKKRRIKYRSPEMKFNPAMMGYEPDISSKTSKKSSDIKIDWKWIIIGIIILILIILIII